MWIVVGLGNPGDEYAGTRHNIGFMVVDSLAERISAGRGKKTRHYTSARGFIEGSQVLLIKPLTFMNRSGIAVSEALREQGDADSTLVVVQDDIDLDTGTIRVRSGGSSGGHKGVESIIQTVGTRNFVRVKIGIGRSERVPVEEYVLKNFPKKDRPVIAESVENAVDAIVTIIDKGLTYAQNIFNTQKKKDTI